MEAGSNSWTDNDGNTWVEDQDGAFIVKYGSPESEIKELRKYIKELETVLKQVCLDKIMSETEVKKKEKKDDLGNVVEEETEVKSEKS